MTRLGISGIIVAAFAATLAFADEPPVTVSSAVDRSRITIGDLIEYTVTVAHQKNVKVEMPGLGANLGGFEIRDYRVDEPRQEGDHTVSVYRYTISTFFTGDFEIPPLTIRYTVPGSGKSRNLATEKIKIKVESVKPSEAGDIRDIKPPVEIPRDWKRIASWASVGAGLLLLTAGGFFWYRRWRQGKGLLPVRLEPPRPPHELALEALARLETSDLLALGAIKAFYIEVSEIIRRYAEGRYGFIALEMTTEELLEALSRAGVNTEVHECFRVFLERCDLVKFAKYEPPAEAHPEILALARQIVDRTMVIAPAQTDSGPSTTEKAGGAGDGTQVEEVGS